MMEVSEDFSETTAPDLATEANVASTAVSDPQAASPIRAPSAEARACESAIGASTSCRPCSKAARCGSNLCRQVGATDASIDETAALRAAEKGP